jgi:hypothetical protein
MKNFASRLLLAFFLLVPVAAFAQSTGTVVADCTTGVGLAYTPGSTRPMTLLPTGSACVNASVSASITGFPGASPTTGTPISVTTGGVTGNLPAGAVVVASNVGATNGAYCKLGASATTSDQLIPPNSWFAFTVGAATQLTCITSTSTTTVNMVGGAGLPTGSGGGGGGSGGSVTQGTSPWIVAGGGTAGSPGTAVLTVQGIGSGTAVPVSGTFFQSTQPVSIASAQVASGAIASGAYASGSIGSGAVASGAYASGAFASGSIASGALASGSIAAGAMVDLLTMRQTVAAGTVASNSMLTGGQYNSTPITLTNTQGSALQLDANGYLKTNVTNTNANGQATMANSSPVVIASNQTAVPVSVASGGIASGAIASGAIASGAVASGAYASGAVSSGAYASGSLASGAVVDITNMSSTTGAAPPSKAIYLGANTSGATGGLVQGLIQCDSTAIYDASTSGSTELVALTSGRTIYVCGYTIMAGGTVNVKLIYGTGTACATGSNNMTPAYQLTAQAGISDQSPFSRGLKTASANALCINTSAGVAAQAIVYYAKL